MKVESVCGVKVVRCGVKVENVCGVKVVWCEGRECKWCEGSVV